MKLILKLKTKYLFVALGILSCGTVFSQESNPCNSGDGNTLLQGFRSPPASAKPNVFMWWFGKITPADITLHMEKLKEKGVGGVQLFDLNKMPNVTFLGKEWMELYRHYIKEGNRLGLRVGTNVCAGWPSGGPWMSRENTVWTTTSSELVLKGPQKFSGKLPAPMINKNLYADLAVQAFPVTEGAVAPKPALTVSSRAGMLPGLLDGNQNTFWTPDGEGAITVDFGTARAVDWAWIELSGKKVKLEGSNDGSTFKEIIQRDLPAFAGFYQEVPPKNYRYYRITVPVETRVRELSLGTKAEVQRVAELAAKRALSNPISVKTEKQRKQLDFVLQDLTPLPGDQPLALDKMIDLTAKVSDGQLEWDVPPGLWKIVRVGRTSAGNKNLPDYLSPVATDENFNKALKLLIDDAKAQGGTGLQFLHEDNVKVSSMFNWTPNMIEEFRTRRGYDPTPYLATLAGEVVGSLDITRRFLVDVRRTIADCVADYHFGRWVELSHKYGVQVDAEAGGPNHPRIMSFDGLMNLGRVDIPVAEFWESKHWKETPESKRALPGEHDDLVAWDENAQNVNGKQTASAAHIYGKKVTASEAFTSLSSRSHWAIAPSDLLLYANIAFCEGINSFTLHGSATSGAEDGYPGKAFAAGTHFNQGVTWWKQAPGFLIYVGRCQHMLQQGLFVADVLYYNGDEVPNIVTAKNIDPSRGFGYDYDVCNTEVLLKRLMVKDGRLVLPDGMSYRMLVLPQRAVMPLAVVEKIQALVEAGATVIGPRPLRTPGLQGYPQSEQRLKELTNTVSGTEIGAGAKDDNFCVYGKGKVSETLSVRAALEKEGVEPDFAFQTADKNASVDFIHRQDGDTEIYFVINRRTLTLNGDFDFRVKGKQPELWAPVTGKAIDATAFRQVGGRTILPLELAPYGSVFVVFKKLIDGAVGGTKARNYPILTELQNLSEGWRVQFDPKWGGPSQPVNFGTLQDWAKRSEDGIKHYSGTATYRNQFTLSQKEVRLDSAIYLDLGVVKNVAEVRLNGKNLGIVWCPPWRIDLSSAIKVGTNELEIDVVNLWPNRMIGDAKLPEDKRFTKSNIQVWYKGKRELFSSGLLGPVKLMRDEQANLKKPSASDLSAVSLSDCHDSPGGMIQN